ncbi:hypothetical protein APSETT444_005554 [Aspergillus pseudonomiae]
MSRPLEGKFGIVTGGSRGIGEAIARNLASKGCSLLLNYTSASSQSRTENLCTELASQHSIKCVCVQADLFHTEEATATILQAAKDNFTTGGSLQVDILINNAGVSKDRFLNDEEKGPMDREYFNWHYTINVLAPLLLTQAVAPFLPTDRSGRIVNISSVSSSIGFTGQTVYGGTKAALEAMTRTWARELADRATVNAVNPGPVIGDMYFATGEAFWQQMQGFMDNTPLSKVVEGDEKMNSLTDEQRYLIKEKMGDKSYETAKDEFEIATDSTNGTTIYAASDRESARDALNQLSAVFALYTTEMPSYDESQQTQQTQPDDSGSQIVSTYFDPADIKPEVRAEVKRRVGQRLRELENAVEALEERAKDD